MEQVYYPDLFGWIMQETFPNKEMVGRLHKGRLPIPKEVNRKKGEETAAASLTPRGSDELLPASIRYLYSF
ncbi:neuronal regeneration-related protein isoform X2 [Echinops telfairi]|uniref:Neuronal regeneration-related protein isoform X2 n=1 Tax=Echinops telfairi TaxID=9371 RepID=A0AC55CNA0_ECHTE|nr:neuronal regeneration-related protein isoform X2 [Echinops telfairi]